MTIALAAGRLPRNSDGNADRTSQPAYGKRAGTMPAKRLENDTPELPRVFRPGKSRLIHAASIERDRVAVPIFLVEHPDEADAH